MADTDYRKALVFDENMNPVRFLEGVYWGRDAATYSEKSGTITSGGQVYTADGQKLLDVLRGENAGRFMQPIYEDWGLFQCGNWFGFINKRGEIKIRFVESRF